MYFNQNPKEFSPTQEKYNIEGIAWKEDKGIQAESNHHPLNAIMQLSALPLFELMDPSTMVTPIFNIIIFSTF